MSFRSLVLLVAGLVLAASFVVGAVYFQRGLSQYGEATAVRAVETRGQSLSAFLSRMLYEEWRSVDAFARKLDPAAEPASLRLALEALNDGTDKVSWAGIARVDGTVLAASRGLLEGYDVSSRPWFQRGLAGPFAGDVHEAVLLERLLNAGGSEPLRFIDYAIPIHDRDGALFGVLGVHLNWKWVTELMQEGAERLHVDAFLVSRGEALLLATVDGDAKVSGLPSFQAAKLGASGSFLEEWPDGGTYFSYVVPEIGYKDLPRFGWSLIVRLDPSLVTGPGRDFTRIMLGGGLVVFIGTLLVLAFATRLIFRPLASRIDAVSRLSRGEDVGYVPEASQYREARDLSNAIARLQASATVRRRPPAA